MRSISRSVAIIVVSAIGVLRSFGAAGDVTALSVATDGWRADFYVDGLSTNLAVANGFSTNNTPTADSKCVILVESPGYDSNGTSITRQREVFATWPVRIPGVTNLQVTANGANAIASIALSDPIFAPDTIVSVTVRSGFLSDGGTNSNAGTVAGITNASTVAYPVVIAKATEPGCVLMTNSTWTLRTLGFAQFSDGGQPAASVWNILTGVTSGHSITSRTSRMMIIRDRANGLPAAEFANTVNLSGFTDNERVRVDTVVFPQVGYTNSVADTRQNLYTWPDARLCAFTNVVDPDDDFCRTAAIVDPAGDNATGVVFDRTVTSPASVTNYFATVAGAFAALQGTNGMTTGETNIGGSFVYLRNGVTNWMGGTYTPNTTTPSRVFPWVKAYPGHTPEITTRLTSNDPGDLLAFDGVRFAITSAQVPFNAFNVLWFRNVPSFTCASTDPDVNVQQIWYDDCIVGAHSAGFKATTATSIGAYFVRNCNLNEYSSQSVMTLFMGNSRFGTNGGTTISITSDRASQTGTPYEEQIVFNNIIEGNATGTEMVGICNFTNFVRGLAYVQNIFLKSSNPSLGPCASIGSSVTNSAEGGIIWANEFINARVADILSNNTWTNGSGPRLNWSFQGNVINGATGFKLDITAPVNANKFVSVSWGSGHQNNWYGEGTTAEVAGNSFRMDFPGVFSYRPPDGVNFTNLLDAFKWQSYPALGSAGNGNYRLRIEAPGLRQNPPGYRRTRWFLPFDVYGYPRSRFDPPGAVAVSNPIRAFAQ